MITVLMQRLKSQFNVFGTGALLSLLVLYFVFAPYSLSLTERGMSIALEKNTAEAAPASDRYLIYRANNQFDIPNREVSDEYEFSTVEGMGVALSQDGGTMFLSDEDGIISQFTLATPFAVSTAGSVVGTYDIGIDPTNLPGIPPITFNHDGTKLYVGYTTAPGSSGTWNRQLREYNLGTPYSLTGGVSLSSSLSLDSYFIETISTGVPGAPTTVVRSGSVTGVSFSDNGRYLYVLTSRQNRDATIIGNSYTEPSRHTLLQFSLSTRYSIASRTFLAEEEFGSTGSTRTYNGLYVNQEGTKLFTGGATKIREYNLTTPHDVSSFSFVATHDVTESGIQGFHFADTGALFFESAGSGSRPSASSYSASYNGTSEFRSSFQDNNYIEAGVNDGSVAAANAMSVEIIGDTFVNDGSGFLDTSAVSIPNLPLGLVPVWTLSATNTIATLSFTGNAVSSGRADNVDHLEFVFSDAAFSSGNAANVSYSGAGDAFVAGGVGIKFSNAPGGVLDGLDFWVRADKRVFSDQNQYGFSNTSAADGVVVGAWNDSGLFDRNLDDERGSNPVWIENSLNFNPAVDFDGNDWIGWNANNAPWFEGDTALSLYSFIEADNPTDPSGTGWLDTDIDSDDDRGVYIRFAGNGFYFSANGPSNDREFFNDSAGIDTRTTEPANITFTYDGTQAAVDDVYDFYFDGYEYPVAEDDNRSVTTGGITTSVDMFRVGNTEEGNNFNGRIYELFTYNRVLSEVERQKVDSYLAFKYSTLLASTTASTTVADYIASDGTAIWTNDSDGYDQAVFGLGFDNISGLNQRIAKAGATTSFMVVALEDNFVDSNIDAARTVQHANDLQFLAFAHDGEATSTMQTTELDLDLYIDRTPREWKVDKTANFTQPVNMQFAGLNEQYYLLSSTDGDFSTGATEVARLNSDGEALNVSLNHDTHLTLARAGNRVEFSATTSASSDEATTDNVPTLLVNGNFTATATIQVQATTTGTATEGVGADYTFATQTVTIPVGSYDGTSATAIPFTGFTVLDDADVEGTETVVFVLVNPSDPAIAVSDANGDGAIASSSIYTITDDEVAAGVTVAFNSAAYTSVDESTVITLVFTISGGDISGQSDQTVEVQTTGGTASSADHAFANPTILTIPAADYTTPATTSVLFAITDDAIIEGSETVVLQLASTTALVEVGTTSTSLVTITDDDTSAFTVSTSTLTIAENNTDTFTVFLDEQPVTDVVIDVSSDATSEATVAPATLTFTNANWNVAQTVTVTAVNDATVPDDTALVTLSVNDASSDDAFDGAADRVVSITLIDDDDTDNDGALDTLEDAGFNGGDGNGDGIADSLQESVSGAPNPVTGAYTTLAVSGDCTFITENAFLAESTLAVSDPAADYPVGLVDFQVRCTTPGDSADVVLYYDQDYDTSNWTYKKYDTTGNVYSDITGSVTFDTFTHTAGPETGTTVTTASFTVTDGDPATDEDGVADGLINDPSGPAVVISTPPSPEGSNPSSTRRYCNDPEASNYDPSGRGRESLSVCEYEEDERSIQEAIAENTDGLQCPFFTEYMRVGSTGDQVTAVQAFMQIKGFYSGMLTGMFDAALDQSVRDFQNANWERVLQPWGIAPGGGTGFLYQSTRAHMNAMSGCPVCVTLDNGQTVGCEAEQLETTAVPAASTTVSQCQFEPARPGEEGENVVAIQTFLNQQGFMDFPATGYYGSITGDAVRQFQTAYPDSYQGAGLPEPTDWFYHGSIAQAHSICR